MHLIESFTASKTAVASDNEDRLFVSDDFVAVFDGATDKSGLLYAGLSGGIFAANSLSEDLASLEPEIGSTEALQRLSAGLATRLEAIGHRPFAGPGPAAAGIIFSVARGELWLVGDCLYRMDGQTVESPYIVDEVCAQARATYNRLLLLSGATLESLQANDLGRKLIWPILKEATALHNIDDPTSPYSRATFNGQPIPQFLQRTIALSLDRELILASDGYPVLADTLAETERLLAEKLEADPLLIGDHPNVKGMELGATSFDDRTYVRIRI